MFEYGLVGTILPMIIAIVQQEGWSSRTRSLVAFGVCLVAAGLTAWLQGQLNSTTDLVKAFGVVYVSAMVTYQHFWSPTGIATTVEKSTYIS